MSVYYVRKTGSDAAAGTSAGAAWLTIGKALGASGIASGDTVWIGAGIYREVVTVAMTSATVETKVYGDVTGANTGDVGEVQFSSYLPNDTSLPSSSPPINLNGKSFLTFQDIVFQSGNSNGIKAITNTSTDIKVIRCAFYPGRQGGLTAIDFTSAANVALNLTVDSCIFIRAIGVLSINITPVRPATADFNVNVVVKNCCFIGGDQTCIVATAPTGANTFNPGGVTVYNCTIIGSGKLFQTATNWSTSITCAVYNCFMLGATLSAATAGQIVEDYNVFMSGGTVRVNITAGTHSISDSFAPSFFCGHEFYSVGSNLMPFGMPKPGSPLLGFYNQASSPTIDLLGAARPSGFVKIDTGTATAGAAKTLTNSGKTFGTNVLAGATIKIISGTGSGQTKSIASNTATVITVDGNWKTNPDSTSVYEVYRGALSSSGTATAGSTTTLTDSNAVWGVNQWQGYTLKTDAGTGSGQTITVISNTATVLTYAASTAVDNTTTYRLYRGTDENTISPSVGCYELSNTAIQETGTVRTGANAIRIPGAGYYDFIIPVAAASTVITVYAQYDSAYSGTLPSMNVINGTQCGVVNATATCVGAANTWEQLSLTIVPTSVGIVTIRILSSTTTPTGNSFWDDFNVT